MDSNQDGMLNRRVLVIDDNEAIHADFRKILTPSTGVSEDLLASEAALFGEAAPVPECVRFDLCCANQGAQGLEMVRHAAADGKPFAMAFVDMRMPPGWDGLETIKRIWAEYEDIEMVICTAFSDYSWEETLQQLGRTDRLLIVKKPFDPVEVMQVASALTHKWNLQVQAGQRMEDLSASVAERTADLELARSDLQAMNAELTAARDRAEAANATKTLFLANISHELRTPMTAILGFADEAFDGIAQIPAMEKEADAVQTIRRNARHLVGIIGDLLDVSKLEAGKLAVEGIICQPLHLAEGVVDLLQPKAEQKGLALSMRFDSPVPLSIRTDPLRLRQILVNLVDNAIKFTDSGSVVLAVALMDAAEVPLLQFSVHDTGSGMVKEVQQRLFRPFEQADISTTRKFGGTGLGLSISRQLAQLLGGDVAVRTSTADGSCFDVTIAIGNLGDTQLVDDPSKMDAGAMGAPSTPDSEYARGARVLLVEDGLDNQRLITAILRRAGCDVDIAGNGQECLDRVADSAIPYDVLLMDVQMPVMDGRTATRTLRQEGSSVPVIALTASASNDDEQACMRAGCDAFLTKPLDRKLLVRTIGKFAKREQAPASSDGQ
ncbi:MAG: two-component system sensor histidine kinase/response regulator [Planctomycetota bacterium]|jgi:two-component system sensor histidine kinase/response regulator